MMYEQFFKWPFYDDFPNVYSTLQPVSACAEQESAATTRRSNFTRQKSTHNSKKMNISALSWFLNFSTQITAIQSTVWPYFNVTTFKQVWLVTSSMTKFSKCKHLCCVCTKSALSHPNNLQKFMISISNQGCSILLRSLCSIWVSEMWDFFYFEKARSWKVKLFREGAILHHLLPFLRTHESKHFVIEGFIQTKYKGFVFIMVLYVSECIKKGLDFFLCI